MQARMRKQHRTPSDAASMQLARGQAVVTRLEPPEGVKLGSKAARLLWDQFTASRLPSDWMVADLLLIGDLVEMTLEEKRLRRALKKSGSYYTGANGDLKPHPLVAEVARAVQQKLALRRQLGMAATNPASRALKSSGASAADHQAADKPKSLLAVA